MNLFVQVVDPSLNADHHSKPIGIRDFIRIPIIYKFRLIFNV
jgi:hypothetical protein